MITPRKMLMASNAHTFHIHFYREEGILNGSESRLQKRLTTPLDNLK